jgi:ABC-type branched-subunit amino acid transport system ATPase component
MSAVLEATGVSVSFGGVRAVVAVDLEVGEGRLVGLIGPNGAGKTTFIDAILGFVRSEGRTSPGCRRTHVRDAGSHARGSRSSCSTTSRSART